VLSALAMCLALAPAASAADLEPLALPDTSSPRATLRTFLTNAARAAEPARQGAADIFANPGFIQTSGMEETARTATAAARDAAETLDFSHIPPALLARTKLESMLMLHEILHRVPVPVDADIPDATMMNRSESLGHIAGLMPAIVAGIAYGLALSCYFFFVRRRALARGETRRLVADFAWPLALTVATDISLFGIGRINIAGSLATYIYLGLSLFSSLAKAW